MSNQPPKTVELIGPSGLAVVNESDVASYEERGYKRHVPDTPEAPAPTVTKTATAPTGKKS